MLQDVGGTLYGYYHGEPNRSVCEGVEGKTAPRIGASRSADGGRTWEDPEAWTLPRKIRDGGQWYPQVIGLERGVSTDKVAGQTARFFVEGVSEQLIVFQGTR